MRKSIGKIAIIFLITDFYISQTRMHDTYSWICPLFVFLLYPASIVWTFETKTGLLNLDIGSLHSRFSSLLAAGDVSSSLAGKSEEKRLLFAKISLIQTVCTFIFKIIVNRVIPGLFRLLICVKEMSLGLMSRDLQERFSRLIDPNADKKLKLLVDFICLPLKFKFDEPFPNCALVNNNARGRGLHCAFPKILTFLTAETALSHALNRGN